MKLLLLLFTFYILHFTFYIPAYAREDSIGQSQINPASPLYFLKSVREILELKFAGSGHVIFYRQLEFATRRIREVKSLSNTSHEDLITPTLARYLSHLQEVNKVASPKDDTMTVQIIQSVTQHMDALQTVYSKVSDPSALRSIRFAVYRLSEWNYELAHQLSLLNKYPLAQQIVDSNFLGCNFLAKEASSSALNEVEKTVFTERVQYCLDNLRKLRL